MSLQTKATQPAYRRVTLLAGLAFTGNGVALGVVSFALAGLREDWQLDPAMAAWLLLVNAVAQGAGGILIGGLADRFGRRLLLAACAGLVALGLGLGALAPGPLLLGPCLFLAGLGFGGIAPVATSLVSEFSPPAVRGRQLGWTQVLWGGGFLLAAAGGAVLLPDLGWRPVLALGLLNAFFALLSPRVTPESPRFLLAHGRTAEAEELARRYGVDLSRSSAWSADRRSPLGRLRELWSPPFRRRTAVLWFAWYVMVAAYNGPVVLFPTLLGGFGQGTEAAVRSAFLVALAQLPAVLLATILIDRIGRRASLAGALGLAALGAVLVAGQREGALVVVGGGALAAGVLAAWPPILSYAAELYPTRMRATAAGWASAVARVGAMTAPFVVRALMGSWEADHTLLFALFALLLAGAALVVGAWGEETAGRTLEELSH